MTIMREEIEQVMADVITLGETVAERNENRRQAVVEFLKDKPDSRGIHGSEHAMILSDLDSYPQWESEDGTTETGTG